MNKQDRERGRQARSAFARTPEQVRAMQENRRRGAGVHGDRRTKRVRTRGAQHRAAVAEW
jgi:hypothetical protein